MSARLVHVEGPWWEWEQRPALPATVRVRLEVHGDGRLGISELHVIGPPSSELLRSIPVGRIEAAANAQLGWETDEAVFVERSASRRVRLPAALRQAAAGRGRPDEFYEAVADAYRQLVRTSSRPATELAEVNGVPVTTVHRWIKEARRRGFLAPGRPGKPG